MRVSFINNQNNIYLPTFGINLQSKKLKFKDDDFFIKIRGYGTNSEWARKVIETADLAVKSIRAGCNFEEILKMITSGIIEANRFPLDIKRRFHTGILRIPKDGWQHGSEWDGYDLITRYKNKGNYKYASYADRLESIIKHPLKNPYKIGLTRPEIDNDSNRLLKHGDAKYIDKAFNHINKIYDNLYQNYILKEVKEENLADVNSSIGEIRWILAHATPWERGSDAISNTFIRSIYKAMGIKAPPLKRGISLDLEAYCTNLNDYKKNFSSYFALKPYIVE